MTRVQMHQPEALQRIIDVYFREPSRTEAVKASTQVLTQGGFNDRLYWVKKGELSGYLTNETSGMTAKVFHVQQGMFVGVNSFFSKTLMSSTTVIAEKDSEIAWIDMSTSAVDTEQY
ncbi:cyclic nucleotide-binding domain-containing protein, partial [Photobacterium swingsii]